MVNLTLGTLVTALLLGSSLVTALPTDKNLAARSAEFHGHPEKDVQVAPLPHGWYGHDATTPQERDFKLAARDDATKAAAKLDARSALLEKRVSDASVTEKKPRTNGPYEFDEAGYIINVKNPRDYPDGFVDRDGGKLVKRFSDAGADPASSWFPSLRKALTPRAPEPIGCASHNNRCRSLAEKRAMAEALSGYSMYERSM